MLKTTRDNLALIAERFGPVDGAPVVALVEQFERAIQQVEKAPPAS